MVLIAGAALAAPALVLEASADGRSVALPLRDETFTYTYRQSIYDATVREELAVRGGQVRIERAASSDLRALEYFRWPGAPQRSGNELVWRAPANNTVALHIVVVRDGGQVIDTGARRALLSDVFGDGASVTVSLHRRPLIAWLLALMT